MKYKDAGVNIEKANQLINFLNIEGFAALINIGNSKKLALSTDGVGTKLLLAEELGIYNTIGIDLVAMCVNDILCHGARPIAFLDYYATGKLDINKGKEILSGIIEGCRLANCPLVGGETAEMPDVYSETGFDLAGFAAGIVDKNMELSTVKKDDLIIGIPSSGFHSNGFSLIRKVSYNNNISLNKNDLTPTRIYVKDILPNLSMIKSMAHITGGGIHGNLPRALPNNLTYDIKIPYSDKFDWFFSKCSISKYEFENIFNCGWGMLLITDTSDILNQIKDAKILGKVINKH